MRSMRLVRSTPLGLSDRLHSSLTHVQTSSLTMDGVEGALW